MRAVSMQLEESQQGWGRGVQVSPAVVADLVSSSAHPQDFFCSE